MDLKDLEHPVVSAIYAAIKKEKDSEPTRSYLGASIIGAKCERFLWYTFRDCCKEEFDGRMYRLFDHGNLEESRMVRDLRAVGCEVHENMGEDCSFAQYAISAFGDHFSGHLDGWARGGPLGHECHVTEYKTHNKKSFNDLKKRGVNDLKKRGVKRSKPLHYAQMQVYMHGTGMKKALYLAVHKDTDTLYVEIVEYDQKCAEILMERAKRIIIATEPPSKYSEDRNSFECTYCAANSICWGNPNLAKPEDVLPRKSCRQCKHARPDIERPGAYWACGNGVLWTDGNPCEYYTLIPGLLPDNDVEDSE